MRVAVVGSGRVAEAFALALSDSELEFVGICARNKQQATHIAAIVNCDSYQLPVLPDADLYIMAVSDSAVAQISEQLDFGDAVVAHTAGSVAIDALSEKIAHRAVIYPLQTFSHGRMVDFWQVPLLVEATDDYAAEIVHDVAGKLSGKVVELDSQNRAQVHLAAVFACNFVNAMYVEAEDVMSRAGLGFSLLAPLIIETAQKAVDGSPRNVQTGPAVRGDKQTMNKHTAMLDNDLKDLYIKISDTIWQTSKKI